MLMDLMAGGEQAADKDDQPEVWQAPPSRPAGYPPRLEYLAVVDQLIIQQQVELFEGQCRVPNYDH